MPTFKCNAACKHCGTCSTPKDNTFLDVEQMLRSIGQAVDCGYKVVVFTGGEATLAEEHLLRGIEYAASRGVCTRLVTNGWWANDEESADAMIAKLIGAGLVEINFSTGDQHARFVPVENVLRACRAAARIPMVTNIITVELVEDRLVRESTIRQHPMFKAILADYPKSGVKLKQSPWMPLSPQRFSKYPDGVATTSKTLPLRTGCTSCLGTTTILSNGQIGACCGIGMRLIPELQVGNIASTSIAEADAIMNNDFLKKWIRVEGPEKILAWAATHDPEIKWEGMYAHHCQACVRLYRDPRVRKVILEHHQEKMADVVMGEWLLYHYQPKRSELVRKRREDAKQLAAGTAPEAQAEGQALGYEPVSTETGAAEERVSK
jgi:hypothetical protein